MTTQRKTLHSSLSKNHLALDTTDYPPSTNPGRLLSQQPDPTTRQELQSILIIENYPRHHSNISLSPMETSQPLALLQTPPQIKPTLIINIYNSHEQMLPGTIHTYLTRDVHLPDYGATIIAGDFNLHHPLWNPP